MADSWVPSRTSRPDKRREEPLLLLSPAILCRGRQWQRKGRLNAPHFAYFVFIETPPRPKREALAVREALGALRLSAVRLHSTALCSTLY